MPRHRSEQIAHYSNPLKNTNVIRSVDIDALIAVIGIAISPVLRERGDSNAGGTRLGRYCKDEKMVSAITDLLVNGLRPRDSWPRFALVEPRNRMLPRYKALKTGFIPL